MNSEQTHAANAFQTIAKQLSSACKKFCINYREKSFPARIGVSFHTEMRYVQRPQDYITHSRVYVYSARESTETAHRCW